MHGKVEECAAWKTDGLIDGWFKWQEKWQMPPDEWTDWQTEGRADKWIKTQSDEKKAKKDKWRQQIDDLSGHTRKKLVCLNQWVMKTITAKSEWLRWKWFILTRFTPRPEARSVDMLPTRRREPASKPVPALLSRSGLPICSARLDGQKGRMGRWVAGGRGGEGGKES